VEQPQIYALVFAERIANNLRKKLGDQELQREMPLMTVKDSHILILCDSMYSQPEQLCANLPDCLKWEKKACGHFFFFLHDNLELIIKIANMNQSPPKENKYVSFYKLATLTSAWSSSQRIQF